MKELKITLTLTEWELIPEYTKVNKRGYLFRWLFIKIYFLKSK